MTNNSKKPSRLNFKTYLQLIRNSVGTNMFRNFYVQTPEKGEFDALKDGDDSCAFFVSSVLKIFDKIGRVHGTIARTMEDLERSGWQTVQEPKPGDVIVWASTPENDHQHLGFYIGNDKAVSNSSSKREPAKHSADFDGKRPIEKIYRMGSWDDNAQTG